MLHRRVSSIGASDSLTASRGSGGCRQPFSWALGLAANSRAQSLPLSIGWEGAGLPEPFPALPLLLLWVEQRVCLNFHICKMGHVLIRDRFLEIGKKKSFSLFWQELARNRWPRRKVRLVFKEMAPETLLRVRHTEKQRSVPSARAQEAQSPRGRWMCVN